MIRVRIDRKRDTKEIIGFRVDGHADYDASGKDIVCAGVSAVTVGIVNAAEKVIGVILPTDIDDGKLVVIVPSHGSMEQNRSLQLLLESMVVMLQSIDHHWREHLSSLDHLRQGIHLRSYAQKNPKQEYKKEAFELFGYLLDTVKTEVTRITMVVKIKNEAEVNEIDEKNKDEIKKII